MDDFKNLTIYGNTIKKHRSFNQSKGQKEMVEAYIKSLKAGKNSIIPYDEIHDATLATFLIIDSALNDGKTIKL